MNDRYNPIKLGRERALREIPEVSDYKQNTYDEIYREGKRHGRKSKLLFVLELNGFKCELDHSELLISTLEVLQN